MKALVAIVAVAAVTSPCAARHTQTAKVRYETADGMSRWQETDVSFLTGNELNDLTTSTRYDFMKNYATILFGKDNYGRSQIAVIRINSPFLICGTDFDESCLPLMGKMKGPDQQGRVWEICSGIYC